MIAGRPNVGKSRLLNALAGYPRLIVDPTPGERRAPCLRPTVSLDGWPIELLDTAGLRETGDAIQRSRNRGGLSGSRETADLVLEGALDRSEPLGDEDRAPIRGARSRPSW